MYMMPTVTSWSNASPVRPSKSIVWPLRGQAATSRHLLDLDSGAPSNTGVANTPCGAAART